MVIYEGIFFDEESIELVRHLEKVRLPIANDEIHCTFKFRPQKDEILDELVGRELEVFVIGYGCDGRNSGFEVQLPDDLMQYYINYEEREPNKLKKPHITTSLVQGAKPINTKNLKFERLPMPYKIKGRFGYWIRDGNVGYISYDKYNIDKS